MNIAIGNQKGGVGTSTLTYSIATAFAAAGNSVLLIDTDPSRTTTDWCTRRGSLGLKPLPSIVTDPVSAEAALTDLGQYDFRLIDVWRYHADIAAIAPCVDFWLAPSMASQFDLDATLRLHKLLQGVERQRAPARVPLGVVFTHTPSSPRSREAAEARSYLCEHAPELHVFKQLLHSRSAWNKTYGGRTLFELPRQDASKACDEFESFFEEMAARLTRRDGPKT